MPFGGMGRGKRAPKRIKVDVPPKEESSSISFNGRFIYHEGNLWAPLGDLIATLESGEELNLSLERMIFVLKKLEQEAKEKAK
jgi:hypothetical protein